MPKTIFQSLNFDRKFSWTRLFWLPSATVCFLNIFNMKRCDKMFWKAFSSYLTTKWQYSKQFACRYSKHHFTLLATGFHLAIKYLKWAKVFIRQNGLLSKNNKCFFQCLTFLSDSNFVSKSFLPKAICLLL